ncbi:MAG: hypothetical protein KJ072_28545 [Verrucomicrobia bacterium]|nr:hypothetical protein [Verrucomicrobiota bacterium]
MTRTCMVRALFQEEGGIGVQVIPEMTRQESGLEVGQQAEGDLFLKKRVNDLGLLALLGKEQEQIRHTRGVMAAPELAANTKFYISFDGTGVPVRKNELVGRPGKQADGSARTREAKLGCVFTQVGLDKEGHPQRDPDSTTYIGAIESSTLFGWRMYAEAVWRGLDQAKTVIALTDGQRYNHTIVQTHFANAVHIVDLFHAYEHLTGIAQLLWGQEAKAPKAWRNSLEAGDIPRLVAQAGRQLPASTQSKKTLLKQLHYFEKNAAQMRYAEFRQKKFFVGSGVVEAGCRTVIGERLKQSGNALVRAGRQRDHCPPLLHYVRPLRGFLGLPDPLAPTFSSCTPSVLFPKFFGVRSIGFRPVPSNSHCGIPRSRKGAKLAKGRYCLAFVRENGPAETYPV